MELPPELELPWRIFEALYRQDHEAARYFYLAEILPRELKILKERHQGLGPYAASVHTLGTSVEAPVIAASLLGAGRVHLLATKETERLIPDVTRLLPGVEVSHDVVPSDDMTAVVEAAVRAGESFARPLALDMTGGTKVMAAGMAIAAEHLGADLYYLASKTKNEYRRPLPASERLVLVRNSVR